MAAGAHLDTPTLAEVAPLPARHERGEGLVELSRSFENPLSLTLSPLLRRGERESNAGLVAGSGCALAAGRMAVPLGFFLGRCDLLVIVGKYLVPTAVAMEGG